MNRYDMNTGDLNSIQPTPPQKVEMLDCIDKAYLCKWCDNMTIFLHFLALFLTYTAACFDMRVRTCSILTDIPMLNCFTARIQ